MTHCDRVLDLLRDGREHSYREGYALGVMLHSRVSDLRKRGHRIEMRRDGNDYLYTLRKLPASQASGSTGSPQSVLQAAPDLVPPCRGRGTDGTGAAWSTDPLADHPGTAAEASPSVLQLSLEVAA